MFMFKKRPSVTANKPPVAPGGAHKVKTAEEAKQEAIKQDKVKTKGNTKEKEEPVERAGGSDGDDDQSHRMKASRRISQTQFGKPLSYNQYITQTKLNPSGN